MEIIFNKAIEEENRKEIEKYLNEFIWLIPSWLHKLTVFVNTNDEIGHLAGMRTRFQYREADLDICPEWFVRNREEKRDAVLHEFCHLHNYQIFDFADRLIQEFVTDEKASAMLSDEMTRYLEGGTQDLTRAILNKFNVKG